MNHIIASKGVQDSPDKKFFTEIPDKRLSKMNKDGSPGRVSNKFYDVIRISLEE